MRWRSRQMLILLCAVAGCGGGDGEEAAAAEDTVVASPEVRPLTEPEALGVLYGLSRSAAAAADSALPLASAVELRRLLGVVRADHQALQAELRAIADSLQLTAVRHPAVERVESAAQAATRQLAQLAPGSADATLLQQQARLHGTLLAVLDSTVLPGLPPSLVADYARAVRPAVAAHLQRAHQIEVLLRQRPAAPAATPARPTTPAPAERPAPAPVEVPDTTPPPSPPDTGRVRAPR